MTRTAVALRRLSVQMELLLGHMVTSMKHGTWKEADGAVLISWKTGWTTRIAKQGDKYVKTSFKPGTSITDTPTDTSEAKKKD